MRGNATAVRRVVDVGVVSGPQSPNHSLAIALAVGVDAYECSAGIAFRYDR